MVHDNCYLVFCSCEVVSPLLECLDDCQEFSVIDIVIPLNRGKGGGMVGAGVKVSVGVPLHEYPSSSGERGISHDVEWFRSVQHFDYWSRDEHFLEFDEHVVLFFSLKEGDSLFGQVMERLCKCREVGDKLSVEIAEPDEQLDCFYQSGGFPILYSVQLSGVHMYFSILDH